MISLPPLPYYHHNYSLLPRQSWEVDLIDLKHKLHTTPNLKAVVITNPSNPTGSNYSRNHLQDICRCIQEYNINSGSSVVIIGDEIYGGVVYSGEFHTLHSVKYDEVVRCSGSGSGGSGIGLPLITVSGLAKEFIVPGWRVGWCVVSDGVCSGSGSGDDRVVVVV